MMHIVTGISYLYVTYVFKITEYFLHGRRSAQFMQSQRRSIFLYSFILRAWTKLCVLSKQEKNRTVNLRPEVSTEIG